MLHLHKNVLHGDTMVNEKVFSVFFREKPALLLLNLLNAKSTVYASTVAKSIDCTYSHVVKLLQELEKAKLVTFNKTGRLKLLALTKKGQDIAEQMEKLRSSL
jgi:DNA-binding MarR family transcriptional regulator